MTNTLPLMTSLRHIKTTMTKTFPPMMTMTSTLPPTTSTHASAFPLSSTMSSTFPPTMMTETFPPTTTLSLPSTSTMTNILLSTMTPTRMTTTMTKTFSPLSNHVSTFPLTTTHASTFPPTSTMTSTFTPTMTMTDTFPPTTTQASDFPPSSTMTTTFTPTMTMTNTFPPTTTLASDFPPTSTMTSTFTSTMTMTKTFPPPTTLAPVIPPTSITTNTLPPTMTLTRTTTTMTKTLPPTTTKMMTMTPTMKAMTKTLPLSTMTSTINIPLTATKTRKRNLLLTPSSTSSALNSHQSTEEFTTHDSGMLDHSTIINKNKMETIDGQTQVLEISLGVSIPSFIVVVIAVAVRCWMKQRNRPVLPERIPMRVLRRQSSITLPKDFHEDPIVVPAPSFHHPRPISLSKPVARMSSLPKPRLPPHPPLPKTVSSSSTHIIHTTPHLPASSKHVPISHLFPQSHSQLIPSSSTHPDPTPSSSHPLPTPDYTSSSAPSTIRLPSIHRSCSSPSLISSDPPSPPAYNLRTNTKPASRFSPS